MVPTYHKPVLKYNGITVLISHPSRFDTSCLISGVAGHYFEAALKPFSRYGCDIRTLSCKEPFHEGTRVVLLCGAPCLPVIGLSEKTNLDNIRGGCYEKNGIVYIPTYHPQDAVDFKNYEATLNPNYVGEQDEESEEDDSESAAKDRGRTSRKNYKFWFNVDVEKAVAISTSGLTKNSCVYKIRPNSEEFINWCKSQQGKYIYFDIETEPSTHQITCFSVSSGSSEVFTIPIIGYNQSLAYDRGSTARILQSLARLFKSNTIVIHNAMFDLFILLWKYKIPPPPTDQIHCTMSMWHRCYAEVEKSLGHVISALTHEIYHKDEGHFAPQNIEQENRLLRYNAKDVERLAQIHTALLAQSKKLGAEESCRQVNASIRGYLTMMYRGLALDNDKLCAHIDNLGKRVSFFEDRILPRLVGFNLNPRSPVQVASYLYDSLGLERPKGKNVSLTGKKQLYKIALKHDIPAVKVILALRRWSREVGQISFQHWRRDGIVTCAYILTGTKSFRLSSRALLRFKSFKGWGTNLQNWNKDRIRYLIVPFDRERNVFIQVDQAGAEALIVAYLCKTGNKLRELFTYGIKPHTYVAAHLFAAHWRGLGHTCVDAVLHSPIADIKNIEGWKSLEKAIKESDNDVPSRRFYYMAKQTCHSANYGIKAPTFVMNVLDKSEGQVVIPLHEGSRFLGVYHDLFPEIRLWHDEIQQKIKRDRTLHNLFGHPRKFFGSLSDDETYKEAYSWIPQSTVGCITHYAFEALQRRVDAGDDFAVEQNNHDSLLIECPKDKAPEVTALVLSEMKRELRTERGEVFRMGAEAGVGQNWKDIK